jgi:hypothetical protein
MSVKLINEIDLSKLTFDKKKPTKIGPENCKALYEGKEFNVQLPRTKAPFGISNSNDWKRKQGQKVEGDDKFSLEISLDQNDKKVKEFTDFCLRLNEHIMKYCADNSREIYGEIFTIDEIRKNKKYKSVIREKFDKVDKTKKITDYADRFKIKLPIFIDKETQKKTAQFKVLKEVTVDSKKCWEPVSLETEEGFNWEWASKNMEVIPIIQCEGLWIINSVVFCAWRVVMLRVCKGSGNNISEDSFREDPDETHIDEVHEIIDEPEEVEEEEELDEEEE